MGRIIKTNKKNKTLQVRMTDADKNILEAISKKYNYKSVSKFIRNIPKIINTINTIDVLDDLRDIHNIVSKYHPDEKDEIILKIEDKIIKWGIDIGI